jgi:hypothetical protein
LTLKTALTERSRGWQIAEEWAGMQAKMMRC